MPKDVCQLCHQTRAWHEEHKPQHAFVNEGEDPVLARVPEPPGPSVSLRGDPVLRLALVKLGVISDLNLQEAEHWLRSAAEQGMAVVVDKHEFHLVTIEEWIKHAEAGVG